MSYIQQAFNLVCDDIKYPEVWYACLMERQRVYLGPWEGGTWGDDTQVVAWQEFPSQELAEAAKATIQKLADELEQRSRREHGEHCLREMEWLDARGLDADFLPEPDGPTEYYVIVSDTIPTAYHSPREYS